MRQQQPHIEPPPHRDHLAAIEYLFPHPAERALRQHRLGMIARLAQRREPPGPKRRIAPPHQVQPRARHSHPRRRHPHIAVLRQRIEEPQLAFGGEHGIVGQPGKELPVPGRGTVADGGGGHPSSATTAMTRIGEAPLHHAAHGPPLRAGEAIIHRGTNLPLILSLSKDPLILSLPKDPLILSLPMRPPALLDTAIGIVGRHGAVPCVKANRPCCRFWGCRKIEGSERGSHEDTKDTKMSRFGRSPQTPSLYGQTRRNRKKGLRRHATSSCSSCLRVNQIDPNHPVAGGGISYRNWHIHSED